ncbi:MAG: 4Fe-4S dicluster domain-containing protein [Alphaproteobacteria bacterium]|jgi:molybdopterin-containing oxidoreductase family iron-sulfur binding subunit|nr:4Fe-4S ferredoxin [Rhodospirillaceae bacterium]MDP6407700.1 4Fe-4S dicluster domain-containing protein [Alphaproteobacteria bacterium]MDP6621216.1 4Fe-4S dicluster domain-containing protein [Alphaproteobacteria bacterium]
MTGRRALLKGGAAFATLALAPGLTLLAQARPAGVAASAAVRWGLLIDAGKCADDCQACIAACADENGLDGRGWPATDAQWIRKVSVTDSATGASFSLPLMCQHCANPPCVDVCPTGASFRRADGIVLVDKHICIGCRYCMLACPYKARSFVHEPVRGQKSHAPRGMGTVESCTFCVHRVDRGDTPACVEACAKTHQAMVFGDLNDPQSEISRQLKARAGSKIRADLGLDPGVVYRGI